MQSSVKSVIALIGDILADAHTLLMQELQLAKHELQEEGRKTLSASLAVGAGIFLALFGGLFLLFMLVHLLNALTGLPLWACYGSLGGLLVIAAVTLLAFGIKRVKQVQVLPVRTVETLKENVQWFKEIATSSKI
ncbi:MAG TPA: phage holin family protein [Nitrospirales bacterium]|jgi:uncharacterized membrane protein YqjE